MTSARIPVWRTPWPGFLDRLDSDPDAAWREFHEFAWRVLRATPPPVFRDLDEAVREDLIAEIVFHCAEEDFRVLRGYADRGLPFASWLGRLARNRALDWVRRQKPRGNLDPDLPLPPADVAGRLDRRRFLARVAEALERLKERCRLLLLAAADGLKPREIAAVLGEPPTAAKKISDDLRYCRKSLRRDLAEQGEVPDIAGPENVVS